jgi:hypothetical protein
MRTIFLLPNKHGTHEIRVSCCAPPPIETNEGFLKIVLIWDPGTDLQFPAERREFPFQSQPDIHE